MKPIYKDTILIINMVSIAKKTVKRGGKVYTYYQVVESNWIRGKSIPKVLKHLGTAKRILKTYEEYERLKKIEENAK